MNAQPPLQQSICPACGQSNLCAMAAGQDAQGCWCMQAPVSKHALARLPASERGQRCICPVCARATPDDAEVPRAPL